MTSKRATLFDIMNHQISTKQGRAMLDSLFRMNDMALFVLLNCFSISFSVIAIFIIRYTIPLHLRYKDNAVIGNTASVIAVIYGVLAGLAALYLINNNSYTSDAVLREANAAADIYRDSKGLKQPGQKEMQVLIKKYLIQAIKVEWPQMELGQTVTDKYGNNVIDQMNQTLINYAGTGNSETLMVHDMIQQVRTLYDARQQRIQMSYSELTPELWVVILIGTILTLCINYLFGMNIYLHLVTVCAAALMTSSMIFLLITLDRPFQGEFVIEPDALNAVLTTMNTDLKL
jgi:hypothetical protein